jgi:hypothetical protein
VLVWLFDGLLIDGVVAISTRPAITRVVDTPNRYCATLSVCMLQWPMADSSTACRCLHTDTETLMHGMLELQLDSGLVEEHHDVGLELLNNFSTLHLQGATADDTTAVVLGVHVMMNEKLARLERLIMIPPTLLLGGATQQ